MRGSLVRTWSVAAWALLGGVLAAEPAAPSPAGGPARVVVAPTRTSIYVGSVGLQMPPFVRTADGFESTYTAKVRPYFFANETGTIRIHLTAELLERLAGGEPIEFTGEATNHEGEHRTVTGRARPTDPQTGTIKVRVRVSPKIELIFNTTYRFEEAPE